MASIIPVATQALALFQTASTIANVLDDSGSNAQKKALQQLEQQQKLSERQNAQNASLQKQEIDAKTQEAELKRRQALKRAVARQRAQFGGSGVATGDGSSEAVLLGLFEESDAERKSREQLDQLRKQSIDQNLLQQKNVNTLQRTQLAERQRLSNNLSALDAVSGIFE